MVESNVEETNTTKIPEKPKEIGDLSRHKPVVTSEAVYETSSDEGWQEASSKGRSANGANRKSGRRQRPLLSKLNVNGPDNHIYKEASYRNDTTMHQKASPKVASAVLSPSRKSKTPKALPSKIASTPTSLSSLASKSISYKEVAVAPPGTVLKPLLEKTETEKVSDENETPKTEGSVENSIADVTVPKEEEKEATHEDESEQENSASEREKVSLSSDQAKSTETNGSKLSAAAKPFSPGTLSASRHLNPVPLATIYDANGSQGILVEPILPPAAARVPCGPRSPLYYRTNYTFRMKHGSAKIREISGSGGPRIMNPHAPEFVPRRASQTETGEVKNNSSKNSLSESEKSEIARQILLSFLVKSVHQNADTVDEPKVSEGKVENFENSSDEVAKDSAVIKIMYGTEEKNKTVVSSSDDSEESDKIDGEGFVVVTNRRKNRQKITNGVTELYNQPSICASVR